MITYKDCYKILDDIRIEKNMSVEEFCEGIISPRTYYRYLKSNEQLKIDTFSKLVDKVGLNLGNLVLYGIHFKQEDPGIIKFIYREHFKSYHDIKPIYEKVKTIDKLDKLDSVALQTYILKYEYDNHLITKEDYHNELMKLMAVIGDRPNNNIHVLVVKTALFELDPKNEYIDLDTLGNSVINIDFRLSAMYYVLTLDKILSLMLEHTTINPTLYETTFKQAQIFIDYMPLKNLTTNYKLYHAYNLYLKKNIEGAYEQLSLYLLEMITLYGGKEYESFAKRVTKVFKINIKNFLIENLATKDKTNHIIFG